MKCYKCGARVVSPTCSKCSGNMSCNDGKCNCDVCNNSATEEELVCDACLLKEMEDEKINKQ